MTLAVEPALKARLQEMADASGRSMAFEAERILSEAVSDGSLGGPEIEPMLRRMALAAKGIMAQHDATPSSDLSTYYAVKTALLAIVNSRLPRPKDERVNVANEKFYRAKYLENEVRDFVRLEIKPVGDEVYNSDDKTVKQKSAFAMAANAQKYSSLAEALALTSKENAHDPETELVIRLQYTPLPMAEHMTFLLKRIDPRTSRRDFRLYHEVLNKLHAIDKLNDEGLTLAKQIRDEINAAEKDGRDYLKKLNEDMQ